MTNAQPLIRPVTAADVESIVALKKAVWPDESASPQQIRAALQTPSHQAFLAIANGVPAGFVSCFLTTSPSGANRWEIDLLAVHPAFRRLGLASNLVKTAVGVAQADICRALIAVGNVGSQKAFKKNSFATDGQVYSLYISTEPAPQEISNPPLTHLVEVETFNYNGVWVEGTLSAESFPAAQWRCQQRNLGVAGALVHENDQQSKQAALAHAYQPVGNFQKWYKRNSLNASS